ncbi:ATP synthase subunit s, mitochondrial [Palaemon carinicauda]|uniref:ATP synthase subunit s, mitochondrial n=1 Tax=Palaemon carinicauda TaxID=392227 RepID=UPI0035B614FC
MMIMAFTLLRNLNNSYRYIFRSFRLSSRGYSKIAANPPRNIWFGRISREITGTPDLNCLSVVPVTFSVQHRCLWGWLNAIFNKVDENRIKEVGPDRACAEWLLRCGALVKWQNRDLWTKDYNTLPQTGGRSLKIEEIDATDAAIMHIGFQHFKGCKHIKKIVFHKAIYLDDAGMALLPLLKDSLQELQVSSCGNVTPDGLRHIKQLVNLEYLHLYDLPEIRDKEAMAQELQAALPNCAVVFPYAQPEDDPNVKQKDVKE